MNDSDDSQIASPADRTGPTVSVSCADCGFLALRNNKTGLLDEADYLYRMAGVSATPASHYPGPICFRRASNLNIEIAELLAPGKSDAEQKPTESYSKYVQRLQGLQAPSSARLIRQVIKESRSCTSWRGWNQGFTPKEHQEKIDREYRYLQEEQRLVQQQAWQQLQEARANNRHRELIRIAKRGLLWEGLVIGIIATLILAIATLATGSIQSGDWTPPWAKVTAEVDRVEADSPG